MSTSSIFVIAALRAFRITLTPSDFVEVRWRFPEMVTRGIRTFSPATRRKAGRAAGGMADFSKTFSPSMTVSSKAR
jgi:hypothetical protein